MIGCSFQHLLRHVIHQIDDKNDWLLLSASFTAKFRSVFVLRLVNAFSQRFHFKGNRKSIDSSKKVLGIFIMALRWKDQHLLCGNSEQFRYFNFELDCLENENLFQKTEVWIFSYGVQLKALRFKMHHFHTRLPYQKPMLIQIKQ